ncbi:MAG: SDR family oxidoreductase [Balneolaceae bacterium]
MNNKLCVITGANSGIGFETTKALAAMGAYIVMVCRDEDKAEAARKKIISETANPGIEIVLCDFAIQAEIRNAADQIKKDYDKIDVLINNHGFIASKYVETVDGLEETFAVNHIGYFLFTNLLLDNIKAANNARIINVSSTAHRRGKFNPENSQLESGFTPMKAYANSKLFNILFTKELAKRLENTSITANCLHPGVIATNFGKNSSWYVQLFFRFIGRPFLKTARQGARGSINLATSPEVKQVSGVYFKNRKVAIPSKSARDEQAARQLWGMSEKFCGL